MSCDICQRAHHPKRLPFFCVVDARNELYEGRVANARVLLEAEELESRVNKLLAESTTGPGAPATNRSTRTYVDNCISEEHKAKARTENIIASADKLRDEVAAARTEIEERKASIARRKSDLAAASQGLPARRNREIEETRKVIKMTKYTWDREYDATAQYRAALCMEVAKLYRLQRVRRGNRAGFEYKIGGIDIIDLHNLNNVQPELISASLVHITHLLWLASHYLSIRLPAEITLPHNDYPRPTIFSLTSSYHHGDVPFPGSTPFPPDPRDRQFTHVPHPRPLFIDRPLSVLAKEDPLAYNAFLEAVCLLSYDIVWLCRTQGVSVGDNGLEDFACMGRNLYNLLINFSLQRNPQQIADASNTSSSTRNNNSDGAGGTTTNPAASAASELGKAATAPRMGWYSHGSIHTFLGGAAGTELTRGFRMPNVIKIVDRLKAKLVHENPVPEWELLEDDAWTPDDALDDGVLVGSTSTGTSGPRALRAGERGSGGHRFGIESYMSVNTAVNGDGGSGGGGGQNPRIPAGGGGVSSAVRDRDREREKGTSGWTKIKPR
ncbi:UV radiation resistance protein and autophagy-related subunit 14-domain-containing protein [Whalleya microplaca]|nr:UV radiation resistance protein and autophagy-related subunit 14-domain-containing protein [Whalleya microplaca]